MKAPIMSWMQEPDRSDSSGAAAALPFARLAPHDFEQLCLWLILREGFASAEHVGASGVEHGRDIVAWKDDRPVSVICMRVRRFEPVDVRRELTRLKGIEREPQQGVLFLVTCDVSDATRRAAQESWQDLGRVGCVQLWDAPELDARVHRHPEIIGTFFRLPTPELARPVHRDAEARRLAQELEDLQVLRATQRAIGDDTADLDQQIVARKRILRSGPELHAGDWLLSRFQLLEPLKSGGFATVWRAWDLQLRQLVAVKVLHGQHMRDASRVERFRRGARLMARLSHPGIVRILLERGEEDRYCFFVMEYLAGGDLADGVLEGKVSRELAIQIIIAVGAALQYAHDHGLVHRDVKPSNILLDSSGAPRLTDFDLVRAQDTTGGTRTGALGSVLFAAPESWEQAKGADARADVYSLAMTLLFCLHGRHLTQEILIRRDDVVQRLAGEPRLASVLLRALASEPDERTASVAEFCDQLGRSSVQLIGGEADALLDRLREDGAELRDSAPIDRGGRLIRARLSPRLRDAYGTAPELLVLDVRGEVEGSDLREAVAELDRRRFDVDPDLLLVCDGAPDLAERLARLKGLPAQCLAWTSSAGHLRPLAELLQAELPRFDVFDERYPVRGRSVVGRASEADELTRRLLRGQAVGLFGLRKVGKTTLLRVVTDRADPRSGLQLANARRARSIPPSTMMVTMFDGQEVVRPTVDYVADSLVAVIEDRLQLGGLEPPPRPGDAPLEHLGQLLSFATDELSVPLVIAIDEYDYLFERRDGSPAIPGIETLFQLLRARAQRHPGALSLVLMGRDPRVLRRSEWGGLPNPLLNWMTTRWVGPLLPAEADELLRRLGRRVLLDVDSHTTTLAYRWTGGHPLLHRQFGSALLEVAHSRQADQFGPVSTGPLCDEALDRYVAREAVRTTCQEVDELLATRSPGASLLFGRLCDAPESDVARVLSLHGGVQQDDARLLSNLGLLSSAHGVPAVFRWYQRNLAPRALMAATG